MRDNDVKKSQFVSRDTINDTDTFDFVSNGQNLKIPFSDLLAALGVTGTLTQEGEVTATPVLIIDGINYKIRNILGNAGILVGVSPENGVQLDHNFINGSGGVDIMSGIDDIQPVLKNIVAGDGVTVSGSQTGVQISISGDPPVSNNTVIVNEMSDFPAAVGGVITLEEDTQYYITNYLTTSDRFVLQNNSIVTGADSRISSLTYTGAVTMFTSTDASNKIENITIDASSGTFLEWSAVSGDGNQFLTRGSIITADILGTLTDITAFSILNCTTDCISNGFVFVGTNNLLSVAETIGVVQAGKLMDFGTSTNVAIALRNSIVYSSAGTYIISGLVDSGNIATDQLGNCLNIRNVGLGDFSENITEQDALWDFQHNDGIPDSINSVLSLNSGYLIPIAVTNTPVQIDTSWTHQHESRFTGDANGRVTYNGKGTHININGTVSAIGTVSQNRTYEFLLYVNGVAVTDAVFLRSFNNVGSGSLSIVWQADLETGDYMELWVQNTDTADDLLLESIKIYADG